MQREQCLMNLEERCRKYMDVNVNRVEDGEEEGGESVIDLKLERKKTNRYEEMLK